MKAQEARFSCALSLSMIGWEADGKSTAPTRLADERDGGAVVLGDMLDDREAEASTSRLAGMALIHPIEPLENAALMLRRNSRPRI